MQMDIDKVRNFALLGHTGSGKTTLIDSILSKQGVNNRLGSVDDGTSTADYTETEKNRKISVWAKPFTVSCKNGKGETFKLVMIDTPGYADFVGQSIMGAHVADAAVIAIDSEDGIQVGTNRAWRNCEKRGVPKAIAITGIEKENADFDAVLDKCREIWGDICIPATLPGGNGTTVVDVLESENVPEGIADQVEEYKTALIESAAETDDSLVEKYLEGEQLTRDETTVGLRGALKSGALVPVFALSAKQDVGCEEMLQEIMRLFPSPAEIERKDSEGNPVECDSDAALSGLVWRTANDPFVGNLNFVRIFSGTLSADSEIYNSSKGEKERIGHPLVLNGKQQEKIEKAGPGEIVAIPKLKHTSMNDSLCSNEKNLILPPVEFPQTVVSYAVYPKSTGDEDKLAEGLHRAAEDDPIVIAERNNETKEMILSGMGDVQLQVAVESMKRNNSVEVELRTPKVAYKETIKTRAEGHYKHKKQSGGHGQYGEVYLRVEPREPDDEEWFANAIVGGAIPSGFMGAVEKGLKEGLASGPLAKYPVTNVKITVYDGTYHEVDSSEVAFKIAASKALHEALERAKPVLLEPVMKIKVHVPEEQMGDVNGDLNHKRGRILGMGSEDGMQVIEANVPQAEVFQYSSQLRSMTGGKGSFELEFDRYDTAPSDVTQKVVASVKKSDES